MGRKKSFPRVDLSVPGVEHTREESGKLHVLPEVVPPRNTVVHFPVEGNASGYRKFDFGPWYGRGLDEITYASQRQIERFLVTREGAKSTTTVASYCNTGISPFLSYLALRNSAEGRGFALEDVDRELVSGYLRYLADSHLKTTSQKKRYDLLKSVLVALGRRGLVRIVPDGDAATFPRNPFPSSHRKHVGERPLPHAQRRAFAAAVKSAVMPLFAAGAEPTSELLSYALLVIALHTGRNTTPLLEMGTDCLSSHPKQRMKFLVVYKRRGNSCSRVPVRTGRPMESNAAVLPTVARLIERAIELTEPLRRDAPPHLSSRIWLYRSAKGANYGEVTALSHERLSCITRDLIREHQLVDGDGKPLRLNVSRLRKTFINRINEILGDDLAATAAAAGNTSAVTGASYLRPGENAQKNWKFLGQALTRELLTATLGATEKTPVGRCSDPREGQYAPRQDGATCLRFLDCLRCRNYVVTGDDLYRLFSFYFRIYAERSCMDPRIWEKQYAHIVRLIDRDVIAHGIARKVFRRDVVEDARERARVDPHPYWKVTGMFEVFG